jgi:hypothetical protein
MRRLEASDEYQLIIFIAKQIDVISIQYLLENKFIFSATFNLNSSNNLKKLNNYTYLQKKDILTS